MTAHRRRNAGAALALAAGLALAGCTGGSEISTISTVPPRSMSLVAFHSCEDALAGLRSAAKASVQPYGLPGLGVARAASGVVPGPMKAAPDSAQGMAAAPGAATPAFSGTNTHEPGVDEPDLVKTDGHRIVTVSGGVLRVIDAATRTVIGRLDIAATDAQYGHSTANMLLEGDHALLLLDSPTVMYDAPMLPGSAPGGTTAPQRATPPRPTARSTAIRPAPSPPIYGPHLLLIDLAGQPRILATYEIDGGLVDARQIGATVRVVIRSAPRIAFPQPRGDMSEAQSLAENRAAIDHVALQDWLPRFQVTTASGTEAGRVPCTAVRRPAAYTGTNLLTVLTFDLGADNLGDGEPVAIAADGDTVYATGSSLYIASDQRWRMPAMGMPAVGLLLPARPDGPASAGSTPAAPPPTMIYRFDISQPGPPTYVASGSVPGYLVDQYAMSEWGGHLRVATTTGTSWAAADGPPPDAVNSESAVYVLATAGPIMRQVGHVGGLGRGERIYSVRFLGPIGYVVTFRQTDPLYTVDLSDPAQPRVRGAVELTGYSAYLHPASGTRLIGIGQQADAQGHVGGTQVSLFDVSDLVAPAPVATFAISGGHSQAEFDPHAFLYWPAMKLVVVPLQTYSKGGPMVPGGESPPSPSGPQSGALILRIDDSGISEVGFLSQPTDSQVGYAGPAEIERSLVIGQTLWTVSNAGVMATELTNLQQSTWIPFT